MALKKETVNTKDEQGNNLVLDVKYPSGEIIQEAQRIYTIHWQNLVENDVKVKRQINELLEKKGVWTKKEDDEKDKLSKRIIELGKKLTDKKVKKTRKQGREIAIQILKTRNELRELLSERSDLEAKSAESLAENVRFDYLVSVCTVYNTNGEPYFKDYEDYINRREEQASWDAATKLASMIYGGVDFSEKYEDNLIEVQFLKQFGFINKDKKFVDENGNLVDIDGNPPTPDDVDVYGNKIIDGKSQFEFGGFDDEIVSTPKVVEVSK